VLLTRIAYRNTDPRLAHELLDQGERIAESEGWPRMQAGLLVERLRLFVDAGNLTAATGCLARLETLVDAGRDSAEPADAHVRGYRRLASAYLDITSGRFGAAVDTLECAWQSAIQAGGHYFAVRVGTVQAAGMLAGGQAGNALSRGEVSTCRAGWSDTTIVGGPEVGRSTARKELSGRPKTVVACYLNRLASARGELKGLWVRPRRISPVPAVDRARGDVLRLIAQGQWLSVAAVLESAWKQSQRTSSSSWGR
jgi:hypothetical protein